MRASLAWAAGAIACAAGVSAGQTSPLFLSRLFDLSPGPYGVEYTTFQGGARGITFGRAASGWPAGTDGGSGAFAVGPTLRELQRNGREFDLGGTPTGATFAWPFAGDPQMDGAGFYDGAGDGQTRNWATAIMPSVGSPGQRGGNAIWEFDTDWRNPRKLFDISAKFFLTGVTYDARDNSLWTQVFAPGTAGGGDVFIQQREMNGDVVSSFSVATLPPLSDVIIAYLGLAIDPADGTLWSVALDTSDPGVFRQKLMQWDTNGTLLSEVRLDAEREVLYVGAEFAIPTPGTLALLGLGGLLAARRRRC